MNNLLERLRKISNFLTASMLAVLFFTFLFQIFSRYVLRSPFGWTLELCLILWVWIVFFGCAFIVRDRDHVTFDIFYYATPKKVQLVLSIISAIGVIVIMGYSFLPTIDYIDWMKMRKTTTVKIPFTGDKIPLKYIFSIYGIFLLSVIFQYIWKLKNLLTKGLPDKDRFSDLEETKKS
jgi:TRAP-type C4-dicarboxylate transport system permease small subunit